MAFPADMDVARRQVAKSEAEQQMFDSRPLSQKLMSAPQDFVASQRTKGALLEQGIKQGTTPEAARARGIAFSPEAAEVSRNEIMGATMGQTGELGAVGRGAAKKLSPKAVKKFLDKEAAAEEAALFKGKKPAEGWMESMGKKSPAMPKVPDTFQGFKDLTTKIVDKLKGKSIVSKQFISDLTNSGDVKQVERDLLRNILDSQKGDKVNVKEFAEKVKTELLPLKVKHVSDSQMTGRYENISLPDELRGAVKDYDEHIFESPIKTSAGDVHWGNVEDGSNMKVKNYFGHTRVEDMADNSTRRVIEVQSDLYQKGNLEKETTDIFRQAENPDESYGSIINRYGGGTKGAKNAQQAAIDATKKLKQYNDPTAHFRMIREEVKKAAEDGKTKLQFPTGKTAMQIEGLENRDNPHVFSHVVSGSPLLKETTKVGDKIFESFNEFTYEIQAVEGDALVLKVVDALEDNKETIGHIVQMPAPWVSFGSHDPIYKFYEKDVAKYLKGKYGAKLVTDEQGVSWFEVDVKPDHKGPVEAFAALPLAALGLQQEEDGKYRLPTQLNISRKRE